MIYVSSDWHGVELEKIKSLLKRVDFSDDDFLFIIGDIIDRGEHSVELLKYIMFEPNIKLIRGNHEQMLLDCSFLFDEINEETIADFTTAHLKIVTNWQRNGGDTTIKGLKKESNEMRRMIFEFIAETPLYDSVSVNDEDFLLVHAGLSLDACGKFRRLSESTREDLLWIRPHIDDEYSRDFMTIFGHTPTWHYGDEYAGKILKTDTWIDVDVGVMWGYSPAILRLDDMKEFYLD